MVIVFPSAARGTVELHEEVWGGTEDCRCDRGASRGGGGGLGLGLGDRAQS